MDIPTSKLLQVLTSGLYLPSEKRILEKELKTRLEEKHKRAVLKDKARRDLLRDLNLSLDPERNKLYKELSRSLLAN